MSNWGIRFSKEHQERAKAKGAHLTAIGYCADGRGEAFMYLPPERSTLLWLFAMNLNTRRELTPAEALADAEKRIADAKAKRLAEEAEASSLPA